MIMANKLTYDEAIDTAYDIFLEMASDNLEAVDVMLFTAQFDDRGAAEWVELSEDWSSHTGFEIDSNSYAEIRIGLVNEENDELDDIFAKMLISLDPDNKSCHIVWKKD